MIRHMPFDALPQTPPESRREHLVRAIRGLILRGDLHPGERIVERDVALRTGISRGPLREALRQLEHEGLLVSIPYQGTYVDEVSREEVIEILLPVRLVLERFVFRRIGPTLSEEDYRAIGQTIDQMQVASDHQDLASLVDLDLRFHEFLVERAGNHCLQLWRSIAPHISRYLYRYGPRHSSLQEIVQEHVDLLAAMRSGEENRVLAELERHILMPKELE